MDRQKREKRNNSKADKNPLVIKYSCCLGKETLLQQQDHRNSDNKIDRLLLFRTTFSFFLSFRFYYFLARMSSSSRVLEF